jgi:hypothetical protein
MEKKVLEQQVFLPVPEVSKEKKYFADASLDVGLLAQAVDDIEHQIHLARRSNAAPEIIDRLNSEKGAAYEEFFSGIKALMRNLKPHLSLMDKSVFGEYWVKLRDRMSPDLYSVSVVDGLSDFLQQALKNANLSELGVKSRLEEIENEIDVSEL